MTTTALHNKVNSLADIQTLLTEELKTLFASKLNDNATNRITIEIPKCDIIDFFQKQNVEEKIFWSDRDDKFSMAGIHFADVIYNGTDQEHPELFQTIQQKLLNADESMRYFGGIKFDSSSQVTSSWKKFGTAVFVLPLFELIKRKDSYQFICNIKQSLNHEDEQEILAKLDKLDFSDTAVPSYKNEITNRIDFPERENWMSLVTSALLDMNKNKYDKIVLARKTELTFTNDIRSDAVMHNLLLNASNCFHFCFQLSSTNAFLGATPERLYYRKDKTVKCEAVAGTRARGDDERHDRSLADELLRSKKDIKEHRYVIDSILESLSQYVSEQREEDSNNVLLIQLAKVQHLIKRFTFTLNNNVTDFNLVNSLHPTSAVGGYPKKNIFSEITTLEQFDRGWYAAPVGWISKNTAEFAVAIRSGLVDKNKMTLYSGAGIIDGSIPDSEWDEIENKIENFLKILKS